MLKKEMSFLKTEKICEERGHYSVPNGDLYVSYKQLEFVKNTQEDILMSRISSDVVKKKTPKIIKLYVKDKKGPKEISQIIGLKKGTVSKIIQRSGLRRSRKQAKVIRFGILKNENFFREIVTEEQAYWLGYLYADGCLWRMKIKGTNEFKPLGGRKNKGGQRMGEMETACIIAHDGKVNLSEFLTTKSDCIDLKNQYIRKMMETDFTKEPEEISAVPESVKLLNSYLTVIGIKR